MENKVKEVPTVEEIAKEISLNHSHRNGFYDGHLHDDIRIKCQPLLERIKTLEKDNEDLRVEVNIMYEANFNLTHENFKLQEAADKMAEDLKDCKGNNEDNLRNIKANEALAEYNKLKGK